LIYVKSFWEENNLPNPNEQVKDPETTLLLFGCEPVLENGTISGRSIHPVTTFHNEFPVLREFVAEHLEKAIGDSSFPIPINVDHGLPLDFTKNRITKLRWNPEKMEIEYFGEVEDQVAEDITNGLYKNGVSIEIGFPPGSSIEFVNGSTAVARAVPKGFQYKAVSLLRDMTPSDPTTTLKVWNNAVEALHSQGLESEKTEEKKADAQPQKEDPDSSSKEKESNNLEVKESVEEEKGDSSQPEQEKQPEKEPESKEKADEESNKETGDEESPKQENNSENAPEEEKEKKVLGEAILGSEAADSSDHVGYVSVEKLESILPHPRQHIPWGVRTHLVDPLRRLIFEAKKEAAQNG
jgi:hypothetical protein